MSYRAKRDISNVTIRFGFTHLRFSVAYPLRDDLPGSYQDTYPYADVRRSVPPMQSTAGHASYHAVGLLHVTML